MIYGKVIQKIYRKILFRIKPNSARIRLKKKKKKKRIYGSFM